MKKKRLTKAILVILLFSCKGMQNKDVMVDKEKSFETNQAFIKKFRLHNDKDSVMITFQRNVSNGVADSILYCIVDSLNGTNPSSFVGKIFDNAKFSFTKYTEEGKEEPYLEGQFISDARIKIKLPGTNTFKEIAQQVELITFSLDNFYKSEKDISAKEKKEIEIDGLACEAYVSINKITVEAKDPKIDVSQLNWLINENLGCKKKDISFKDFFKTYPLGAGTEDVTMAGNYVGEGFVSIKMNSETYGCGAAHSMYGENYINFDLNENREIKFADLFMPTASVRLTTIVKRNYDKEYGQIYEGYSKFHLTKYFEIQKTGIMFYYPIYDLTAFAYGEQKVMVSYNELSDLLTLKYKERFLKL